MSVDSPQLGGLPGPSEGLYASAAFGDAEDDRPAAITFDIGGNGSATPYTGAISGLLMKHLDEIRQKSAAAVGVPNGWKRKLRDFLATKNKDLMDFLSVSISSHPTLGRGEAILRKFGNVNLHPGHPSVRDLVLDASGADYTREVNEALMGLRTTDALKDYLVTMRHLFDQYREAGEEALRHETALRQKIDTLDKIQGRLIGLFDLEPNEMYDPLMKTTEDYLTRVFEKNQIGDEYRAFIEAYRKFITLRDVVLMSRAVQSHENEPLCTICLHEPVAYALTPCGHTFCSGCVKKQYANCFMCRSAIRDRVKLFFG